MKDDFEKLLIEQTIKSFKNEPDNWEKSIVGLRRKTDKFEIGVTGNLIYVYKPNRYEFKDGVLKKQFSTAANKLIGSIDNKKMNKELLGSEKKLMKFLNLDSRKNKLKMLDKISKVETVYLKKNNFWSNMKKLISKK